MDIKIAILGPSSNGKSTCVNMLFGEPYADIQIKKSTMTNYLYHTMTNHEAKKDSPESIMEKTIQNNKQILEKFEKDKIVLSSVGIQDYHSVPEPMEFNVVDLYDIVDLSRNISITVYDTPGLEDSQVPLKIMGTNFSNVKREFHNFDIILLVIDINTSFDTPNELDILDFVLKNIKDNENSGIDTKLIVLLNKCDDMSIVKNELKLDNELTGMLNQAVSVIDEHVKRIHPELNYDIIKISCEYSCIYRICQKNKDMTLPQKYFNKLGNNEVGKANWNAMNENEQIEKIHEIIQTIDYDNRLRTSGFQSFKECMQHVLSPINQYSYLMNHIKNKLLLFETKCLHNNISNLEDVLPDISHLNELKNEIVTIINTFDTFGVKTIPIWLLFEKTINIYLDVYTEKYVKKNIEYFKKESFNENDDKEMYEVLIKNKKFYEMFMKEYTMDCKSVYETIVNTVNAFLIRRLGKNIVLEDNLNVIDALIENNYDDWKKVLIETVLTSGLVKQHPNMQVKAFQSICAIYKLNDSEMIILIFKMLDILYKNKFENKQNNNLLPIAKFWDDIIVRSTNKFAIPIYNIRKIFNTFMITNESFTNEYDNNAILLENYLYNFLKSEYNKDFCTNDDLLDHCINKHIDTL
jgi:GTPase SAR1 family protein